jgi:adenylate cyclase
LDVARPFQVTPIKVQCGRDERFVQARRVNAKNFFTELKRRNVYKVAIAYAVVAWLLMQVASQIFPFFQIPNWTVRLVVLLLIIGFPVALILAWAFDLTPEGIKRAEDVDVSKSITLSNLSKETPATRAIEKSIAVLPFENFSEDKAFTFFADGMHDEILNSLAKIGDLKVLAAPA